MEKELLEGVYQLLPGFLVCWVFYGLTAHPKPSQFERVIQALIFSLFVKVLVPLTKIICLWLGVHAVQLGTWTDNGERAASLLLAVAIGLVIARLSNNNSVHSWLSTWPFYEKIRRRFRWLPQWQFTKKTSTPSEWYSAFHRFELDVVLHLADGRRLRGYPDEWSDTPEKGHITLSDPAWVLEDNTEARLFTVERIVVRAKDVEMVEFLKKSSDVKVDAQTITLVESKMIEINKRSELDGHENAPRSLPSRRGEESTAQPERGESGSE